MIIILITTSVVHDLPHFKVKRLNWIHEETNSFRKVENDGTD